MPEPSITDDFIDSLFAHPKFAPRIKKLQEGESFEKFNDLTLSQCSQMETSTNSNIDSDQLVQEISVILMENVHQQLQKQLKDTIDMNSLLLREVKELKARLTHQTVSFEKEEGDCFITKKEHENWGLHLVNQINSCIQNGIKKMEIGIQEQISDVEKKLNGKLQKNFKTINDLHLMIEDTSVKPQSKKRVQLNILSEAKNSKATKIKQIECKEKQKKLQFTKSFESLGNFFKIGGK